MPKYTKFDPPQPEIRHVWDFTQSEVINILLEYIRVHGSGAPEGNAHLRYERQSQFNRTGTISLFVDQISNTP